MSVALVAGLAATGTGCSDSGGSPSGTVSKAASAAASAGAGLASQAAEAAASASAAAERKIDEVTDGVDARDEVKLSGQATDGDGRTTVEVTAHNTADSTKSFVVQVTFQDSAGNLVDAVAVTVSDVPAAGTKKAVARSTHQLSGTIRTKVDRALRY
ncbi:FxLYD domain-containing protein [Streptomyces sp. NPDC059578]|uniref:FxLYD domain-containing protein n=1 Tax=unclassified Streptomyces TaxID=2593676 RepID=UPI003654C5BF